MNLDKLFSIQAKLDERIVQEHSLQGQDLLDKKILALQVELGECANEWRGFKFWSKDQDPRTKVGIKSYYATQQELTKNPLLEEYVDCLHFILSIGLEMRFIKDKSINVVIDSDYTRETTIGTFNEMFFAVTELKREFEEESMFTQSKTYVALFNLFIGLGEKHLGFTTEQIEQAYLDKNKVNHERQENGY